jgi:ribosomal-protein-alanine N-acetyltransferase
LNTSYLNANYHFYFDRCWPTEAEISKLAAFDNEYFPTPWKLNQWTELPKSHHFLIQGGQSEKAFILLDCLKAREMAHLLKILVHPKWRSSGEATKLLESSFEFLKERGHKGVILEVEVDNSNAIYLYQKLGFESIHENPNFYGNQRAALIMRKFF